ncbi:MAG: LytR/AlgR family response regulator transcription factor, partial [Saprospiraceae bacterium]
EKVRQRQRGQSDFGSLEQLFRQMQSQQAEPKRLVLPTSEGLIFLPFEEIVYLQSDSNYTIFYTTHREKIIVSRTLKEFEGVLERHHFFRVHNSFIVNLLQIKRYVRGEGGTVVMRNEAEIEVSRRRKEDFIRKLETSAAN